MTGVASTVTPAFWKRSAPCSDRTTCSRLPSRPTPIDFTAATLRCDRGWAPERYPEVVVQGGGQCNGTSPLCVDGYRVDSGARLPFPDERARAGGGNLVDDRHRVPIRNGSKQSGDLGVASIAIGFQHQLLERLPFDRNEPRPGGNEDAQIVFIEGGNIRAVGWLVWCLVDKIHRQAGADVTIRGGRHPQGEASTEPGIVLREADRARHEQEVVTRVDDGAGTGYERRRLLKIGVVKGQLKIAPQASMLERVRESRRSVGR